MDLNNQIGEISTEELDKLFNSAPEGSPNANNLVVGKNDIVQVSDLNSGEIPSLNEEDLDKLLSGEEIEEEENQDEDLTDEEKIAKTTADKEVADAELAKAKEKAAEGSPEVNTVLKNTVDYLIEQGLWLDFEGREDLDVTPEIYQQILQEQNKTAAFSIVDELINSTGDYGKAIINHIKAGGNPDEIIDLFKEEKALEQIDSSTEIGKQKKIEAYYKDVLGWKDEKVTKFVKKLVEDNEIDSEFTDVEALFKEHYKARLEESQELANQQKAEGARKQQIFVNSIQSALNEDTTLTPQEKKFIASSILEFKHPLSNGQKVNDFYIKFAEMQKDPKEYIELVNFVMGKENYKTKLKTRVETKVAKEQYNFIKGNAAISKGKTASVEINDTSGTKTHRGTDFSFVLKNK